MEAPLYHEPTPYDLLAQLMNTGLVTQEELDWAKENLEITIGVYPEFEIIYYKFINDEYSNNEQVISAIRAFINSL